MTDLGVIILGLPRKRFCSRGVNFDVLWKNVASDKIIENELRLISHLLGIALSEYVLNMCNFSLKLRLWHWQNLVSTLCVTYLIGIT